MASDYRYDANGNRTAQSQQRTTDSDHDGDFDDEDRSTRRERALQIDPASNRLLGFSQQIIRSEDGRTRSVATSRVQHLLDANGSLTSDGLRDYRYDAAGRLIATERGAGQHRKLTAYLHNAQHQRVFKSETRALRSREREDADEAIWGQSFVQWLKARFGWLWGTQGASANLIGTTFVHADDSASLPAWALIGEYDSGSAAARGTSEYLWLPSPAGATLVGMVRAGRTYAIHTDHLGTPRLITDERQRTLWQWSYSAFGANAPTGLLRDDRPRVQAPRTKLIADGGAQLKRTEPRIEMNLRFAGQYRDEESGLNDNWHRPYLPVGGRYTQPDPSGLAGGMNVYAYAANNALTFVDPDAFAPKDPNAKPAPLPMSSVSGSGGAGGGVSKFDAPIKPIPFPGAIMGAWCQPRGGTAAAKGGRLGNEATRAHVGEVATEMEKRGWKITGGGGRGPEEYLPRPGGARRGSSYPDITATKDGKTLRVNTVDTRADGVTPTTREATNAARIRAQTGEHVLTIPKP